MGGDCSCHHTCSSSAFIKTPIQELKDQPVFARLSHFPSGNSADSYMLSQCISSSYLLSPVELLPSFSFSMPWFPHPRISTCCWSASACFTLLSARPAADSEPLPHSQRPPLSLGFPLGSSKDKTCHYIWNIIIQTPPSDYRLTWILLSVYNRHLHTINSVNLKSLCISCQRQISQIQYMEVLMKRKISLNRLVRIESKLQVDGLEQTFAINSETERRNNINTNWAQKILLKLLYLMMHQ